MNNVHVCSTLYVYECVCVLVQAVARSSAFVLCNQLSNSELYSGEHLCIALDCSNNVYILILNNMANHFAIANADEIYTTAGYLTIIDSFNFK